MEILDLHFLISFLGRVAMPSDISQREIFVDLLASTRSMLFNKSPKYVTLLEVLPEYSSRAPILDLILCSDAFSDSISS